MTDILQGTQVLELATVLAGPLVGSFLSEHGADVIKVEPPGGDITRTWKHPAETSSSYFASCNWGKQFREINLKLEEGHRELENLIRESNVLITNYLPRVELKFGLTPDDIRALNPEIVHARLRGYRADMARPAYDAVLQAETGWMSINGSASGGPMKLPVAIIDLFAAHHMKQAILLALLRKANTGKGSLIECDLEASALSNLANQGSLALAGINAPPSGSLHPNIAPYGEVLRFPGGDNVLLAVGSDKQFAGLCQVLGCAQLVSDERFSDNVRRVSNRISLLERLQKNVDGMSLGEFLEACKDRNVPVGKVTAIAEALGQSHVEPLIISDQYGRRLSTSPFSIE